MNKFSKKLLKYRAIFFVLVFLFFVNVHSASAATRTWTGTTSGAWSVASNWGGTAPVAGDDLVFPNGASNLSNTNDLTENIIINSITFTGSGYTLSGSPIILGPGLAGITDSVASGGNTIALDIRLDATRDIIVTNTAESLTISGRIAGAGGINKEGTGTLILTGANTYGGTTKINVGVINARHSTALGTIAAGTEVVGNAVLELQGNINISYEALALRGYGVSSGGALRNISGDNTYAGLITLSSAGGTEIASDAGTLTLNGGVTGAFGLYIDGSGNVTFSKTPIATGAGAVTKTGSGTLTYNFPNTYTGQTTINTGTLLYGVDNAILSGTVVVTGGTLDIATYSDMVGTVTLGTLDLASGTITGSTGMLSSATWTVYNGTISAIIAGDAGALTKSTSGTVVLTRPNQYTGATTISLGILEIQDSLSLGTIDGITTVTAGATLQINGTGLSIPEYITFSGTGHLYTGAIRNTTGDNALTGLLTMGAAAMIKTDTTTTLSVTSKGLSATTLGLTIGGDGNTTFSAPIYGTTAALTKQGAGTLTLEAFNNFTGATNINYGEVVLSGSGAMPLSTTMTISSGGTLTLDNTSSSTVVDRIADSLALTMNGGNFKFIGSSSINTDETAGVLTAGIATQSGNNTVTVVPGSGGSTTMQFASLTRTAGASILFRGTSFGSDPALNVSTLLFKTAPTLTGSSGAANSTTISIIAGAFGDDSVSGTGTDMVTYGVGNSNGLRLLNGAGFSGEYASSLTSNANVKLTSSTTAATSSINSLILSSSASIANAGTSQTITLASGNIINLVSSNTIAGSNTTIAGGSVEINILNPVNLDISSLITTTGGLTKSGAGTLTFSSSAKTYTGLTSVNGGTLLYALNNAISSGNITVNNGTLDIATYTDTVGAVILQTGTITGSSGVLTGTSYSLREGTVSAVIAGSTVVVTRVATNTAPDSVVLLTRENTYTGATTITSGILRIGAAGNGTNTPLGTTGGGTTIANIAALDLNGYTLSTTEAITSLNGLGYGPGSTVANGNSNMGAIMNSSGTPVSYSGAITLGAASRINADYGAMTISSNISGAFAFTSGGFSNMTYSGVISTVSSITKDGIGTLTLSGSNSMAGAISVNVGTVKLGATGGATNTPLGTVAGTTTVALGARLDLNGFSLGTAEPIALNSSGYGLGDFASGGIMNSSASAVTFSGSIANSAGVIIKADFGDINLTAASTITNAANSIVFGGTGNGTVAGTTNITSGTVQKIGTGTWTLSGASTYTGITHVYHGTLKLGGAGSGLNSPLGVIAGGTTVYSGAVLDLNGYTLATAEPLTANGRGISDGGAVVNNSGSSTGYSGAIVQATDSRITNTGAGLLTLTGGVTGAFALYVGGAGNITFSTGVLGMAAGTLTKQGAGTVTATGTHTYTGATRIDAGNFVYGNGTTVLAGTNLTVAGGTFNMGGSTDSIGSVTLVNGTISNGTLTGTAYTAESGTISAALAGGIAFIKNTNNTVTLTGANTISSTTTINAGNLVLSGSGSAVSSTFTINLGGTLTLDNSTTAVASRLGDALALTMNGGNFNFIGNSAGTASETTGALTPATGHNTVTVTPGAGGSTVMTFASLSRTAGSTVLFRGTSLGTASAANISTLVFTATPTLTGGGGASGSTTVSVIKGAFGDTSLSGTGSDMVTYQGGTGLRLLNGAGFSGEYSATLTTNTNVKLTADVAASTVSINSLILNGYGITNASATITMAAAALSGNILMNSATNIAGANTTLGITTYELDILATANATMSAVIGTATSGFVAFSGSSNVTFSAANLYTGTTFINGATFFAGASNVLSSGGVTIVGGTYNLNGNSDTIGALSINAGTVTTGAGVLTLGGTVTTIANNNVASVISGYLGLGANRDFNVGNGDMDNDLIVSAVISGAFTLTKLTGTGLFMLSGNNTYTGLTTVSAGTLRLGGAGGATNTPLGTTAGSTTVTGASSALDLNGYTLGTAEALTLSGASANGALQNTSSTGVSYSGLITLGAASTIISNYGDINITNTGNITGTGFLLTVGGAGNGSLASNLNTSTSGALTKNGFGVWTVSGTSTFTGATTVNVGTLKLGAAGNGTNTPLGTSAGGVSVTSGAIFDLNGFTLGTAETATISGTGIASIGAFINSSNNTISYSGAITLGAASRVVNYGSGVLTLTGAISGNFALTVVTVGDVVFSTASTWTGSGTLVKQGSGTLTLAGQYAMNGNMTVSTGVLKLGADGGATNTPLGVAASTIETVAAGAVLDLSTYSFNGASTYERLNLSGTGIKNGGALISSAAGNNTFGAMTVTTGARVINSGSGTVIFAGTITAANGVNFGIGGSGPVTISGVYGATATTATLTKRDSGILTISAASITTGLVRVNGGNLNYGVLNALATPALTVAGGTVDLKGFNETNIGQLTLIDGSIVNTGGAASLVSTATYIVENGTISAVLGGPAIAFTKNTGGTVTLSAANTFAGTTTINAGIISWGINDALSSGALTITGGFADLTTRTDTVGAVTLTSGGILSSTGVLTGTSYPFASGTVSAILGGAVAVAKTTVGTVSLTGVNTYSGTTTITAGVLRANSTSALGDGSGTNTLIFNGGTLQAGGTISSPSGRAVTLTSSGLIDTNNNTIIIAGTVGSASGFTKQGIGTLSTTGAVTLGAALTVSQGTFDQASSLNMTAGTTTVLSSGTWSNTGTGSITLAGNLTNSGTITLNSNNLGCIAGANSIVIRSSVNNTLRSWANGSQGAGTFNIYNVDVDDMTGSLVTAQYSTLSGDTTWTVGTGCGISISGTANGNNTATVLVAVNGTLQVGKTGTIGGGAWTIAGVNAPATNDIVTVWVDNVTDNLESTAVTKYSGTGDISGMVLNTNILTIGSNQNNSVSVTNLGLCDVDTGCLDEDIMHTSNSGALLVQASGNTYTDETLKVLASNTLTVDSGATETVTTEKINNAGIITSIGSPTYTLAGTDGTPFVNSGTFTPSTSTVSYTGNNSGGNTTIENVTYYNMEVNNSAETYVLDSTLVGNTAGTLTITNGTLDTTGSNYGIQFGKINIANTSTAILTANSSTVTLSDTSGTLFTKGSTGVFNAGTSTVLISKQGTGTHTYNSKFGSAGTGNGQFGNYDFGIAVDPSGNIYLGDNSNSRVQKFDSSGTYVSQFGTLGTGNGQFNGSVTGVAIDSSGNIYVADGVLDRVQKFNSSGTYVSQFGSTGTGDGQFDTPFGIAIDPSDNIYVVDGVNSRVQKFDSSGTYVSKFGTLGTGNGQFTNPRGIAIDSSGNIFVVDAWNHRIEKFDSSGNYISQFNDTAGFSYPTGIHIDAYDNIYIADQGHSVISKFNSSGTFIADIATNGATDGLVNQAYNLSSNSSGDIYILDTYNKRIQKFTTANDTQTVSVASGSPSFYNLTFTSPGTKTIGETLTATGALTITAGTVDTVSGQNRTVNAGSIIINGGTFTPQASTVNVTGTGAVFNYTAGTFTAGASTIKLTDTSSTLKTFAGGGQTFNNFWYAPGSGTGTLEVRGANTFSDFKDDGSAAHSILFTAGTTQTITTFTVSGNPGALITINSGNGAGATSTATHTLSKASGIVNSDYLNIQHSVATGGATWNGGVNSTDNQSTSSAGSGWVFSITCTSQVTTGNWNTAGTWSCGSVPTAGATTTIRAGDVITMDIASNVLGAITINGTLTTSGTNYALSGTTLDISSTGTLTANGSTITLSGTSGTLFTKHATGTFTPGTSTVVLSGNGSATVNSGAITFNSLTSSGTGTKTSGEAIVVGGDLIISAGTFNPSMYDLTVTGTTSITGTLQDTSPTATNLFIGAVTVNNGGTWSGGVGNAPYEFRGGLTVNSTSTFTSGYSVYTFSTNPQTIDGTQSITISSLLNTITTGDGLTFSGSNTTVTALAQGTDAVLTFSGTVPTITTLVATANPNTVQYTGSAQTVKGTTYHHLIVNGSGTATLGASTTVNGNATVTAGTLDPTSSYTLTGSGTNILSVGASGTVKAQHSTFAGTYISFETVTLSTGSTVDYALTGTQTIDNTLSYSNLNTSGSGTKTLGGDTTVSGVLTITAGTLDASTFNTTLSGTTGTPFVVTGTFTPNLGTVTYTGNNSGGNTTVAGTNYYHLTINNSAETYVLGGAITGNSAGTLTITDGTLDTTSANNYDIIFGKINIANTATAGLTANGSTITLNETTGTLFTKGRYGVFNAGTSNVYLASGASSWTQQTGSGTRNWRSVASSADGSKLAAVVYNGYIYTSVDNGATWSTNSNSSGSHFWNSITSSTDGIKLAATDGNNGYIYTSSDGGVTWTTNSNSSGQHSWTGIASSSDGTKLVATADSDYIYTSTDSGVTWGTQSNASGTAGWTSVASSADGTKLAATVYSGYIYTSTDSGASWGTQSSASGSRLWYDVAISSDGTKLAAVNNAGYIYTSANSGSSWTQQTNSGVHDWETIAMSDNGNKLIAGASGDYVMTSVDSGVNWTEQTSAGARNWKSVASSADGVKFIGGAYTGYVYTYAPSSSTQNVTVASGSPEFNNLTSYSAGTKSLDAALIVTGALTISAGTFDTTAANNYTVWAGTITINGGTFTPQASIVSLTGASGILFTKSSGTFTAGTSNVDMIGNGSATVASGNPSFYNLTSSGTGTKSLGENLTVTNGLTISAGTFDPTTSFTATGSGTNTLTVSSGATIKVQHSTFAGTYPSFETRTMDSGSTVDYALAGTQTVDEAITYANLNTSGAGTKTLGGDTTASNLTIGASSTLDGSSYTLTLSGIGNVFTNSGTYTANTSTIKFTDSSSNAKTLALGGGTYNNIWLAPSTGTGSYTITGSNTFNDFKDDGTGAHDINFTEGTTTTISSLTLDTNASSRISLKSSIPSLYWYLVDSSGTNTVSYISIEDSCASGGASWIASDGTSIDVNHNCGWVFFVGSRGGGSGGSVESSATPQGGVTGGGVDGGSGGAGGEGSGDVGTCADSIQNGDETGVDSGGRCAGNGGQGGGGGGDLGFSYTRSMLASAGSINFRQSFRNLFGNLFRFF